MSQENDVLGIVDESVVEKDETMPDTDIQLVRKASIDLFVDERPQYPENLHVFPESYTIKLPSDQYNPAEKVFEAEQAAKAAAKKTRKRSTKKATTTTE